MLTRKFSDADVIEVLQKLKSELKDCTLAEIRELELEDWKQTIESLDCPKNLSLIQCLCSNLENPTTSWLTKAGLSAFPCILLKDLSIQQLQFMTENNKWFELQDIQLITEEEIEKIQIYSKQNTNSIPIAPEVRNGDFDATKIGWDEKKEYKAAGFLIVRENNEKIEVLVPIEYRYDTRCLCIHLFGGMKDYSDKNSFVTAVREFKEETAGIISKKQIQNLFNNQTESYRFWFQKGKYALYICKIINENHNYDNFHKLPELFDEFKGKNISRSGVEADKIVWVSLQDFLNNTEEITVGNKNFRKSSMLKTLCSSKILRELLEDVK